MKFKRNLKIFGKWFAKQLILAFMLASLIFLFSLLLWFIGSVIKIVFEVL